MSVRAPGSIGQSAYPSRVIKGTKSSGHMGDERVTVRGLTVAKVDAENNLLMVRGAVPGANGSLVIVKKRNSKWSESWNLESLEVKIFQLSILLDFET